MEFKYYQFGENIYDLIFENYSGEKQIFLFKSEIEKNGAKPYYYERFKFEDNIMMTMQELKDLIFPSQNPVLREEKRILIFYKILTKEEREFFGIKSYFDSIDIANNFFILMSELTEAEVEDSTVNIELDEKQRKIYEQLKNIKKRYEEKLKELSFDDYIILNKMKNIDSSTISNYQKIIFINFPYFTNLEKSIIKNIEKNKKCEIHIYNSGINYCEESLCIKDLNLDKKCIKNTNLKINVFDDKFIETVSLTDIISKGKKSAVIECDSDGGYTNLLSVNLFSRENSIEFTESTIFKFIASLYNLYSSMEVIDGNRFLNGGKLLELLIFKEFKEYFNIKDTKEIIGIISNGNKYINSSVKSVSLIFNEMEKIDSIKSIGEFLTYLLSIDISKFSEIGFKNIEEVYYSAIFEMSSMESMKIIEESEYELFFGNRKAENIFRLILKFLRFKKIKPSYIKNNSEHKIFDFKNCDTVLNGFEKIIFLNLNEGVLPSKTGNNFLFTEKQRKELGFITFEDKRNFEKFKFLSLINASNSVEFYTIYNENKNISVSSFADELMINMNLTPLNRVAESQNYSQIVKAIYNSVNNFLFKIEECVKNSSDLENLKIGYYDFSSLKGCSYKFYVQKILGIEKEYPEISYSPEMVVIGIIVHDIFRVVFEEIKIDGVNNFNKEKVIKIIKSRIKENREKFPVPYVQYYEKIIAEYIADSIWYFIEENRERIESADIFPEIKVEKTVENSSVKLSGRLDLMTVKNGYTSIFDYKTGSGNIEQLDFYQSLIIGDDEESMDKIIYSVFKMENEVSQKRKLWMKDIEKIVIEFLKSNSYKKSETMKECQWCEYKEICRPDEYETYAT